METQSQIEKDELSFGYQQYTQTVDMRFDGSLVFCKTN